MVKIPVRNEDYVITDRGGIVENRYAVHAAVVDANGNLLYAVGDPARVTLARSAAKPAQALAVIETGCLDIFGFDDADLALMCGSHNSEDRHITRARSMLSKAGIAEDALRCGGHPAISPIIDRGWIKNDFVPTAVYNNCSGKHAGMLAGSKTMGTNMDYHLPDHPMQVRVRRVFQDSCGLEADQVKWGIDGCNLPAPACPLRSLARMYASFATAADNTSADRIFRAMTQYPELVGGDNRFCTELMTAFRGTLMGKIGADGCYGIGLRGSMISGTPSGIAVKIEDGNINILYSAVMEILEQLQIGTPEVRQRLSHYHCQSITNTVGVVTGKVSHMFTVRSVV